MGVCLPVFTCTYVPQDYRGLKYIKEAVFRVSWVNNSWVKYGPRRRSSRGG